MLAWAHEPTKKLPTTSAQQPKNQRNTEVLQGRTSNPTGRPDQARTKPGPAKLMTSGALGCSEPLEAHQWGRAARHHDCLGTHLLRRGGLGDLATAHSFAAHNTSKVGNIGSFEAIKCYKLDCFLRYFLRVVCFSIRDVFYVLFLVFLGYPRLFGLFWKMPQGRASWDVMVYRDPLNSVSNHQPANSRGIAVQQCSCSSVVEQWWLAGKLWLMVVKGVPIRSTPQVPIHGH